MKHNPTPFYVSSEPNGSPIIRDANGNCLADTRMTENDNATFIVRACNSHDALIQKAAALLKATTPAFEDRDDHDERRAWQELRDALAAAQVQS